MKNKNDKKSNWIWYKKINWKSLLLILFLTLIVAGVIEFLYNISNSDQKVNRNFIDKIEFFLSLTAIPSFIMSFVVLQRFDVKSDLNAAVQSELEDEKILKLKISKFSSAVDNGIAQIKSGIKNIEKYYNIQSNNAGIPNQISPQIIKEAIKFINNYKEFYENTHILVKEKVESKENISNILEKKSTLDMSLGEIEVLEKVLNDIDDSYFRQLKETDSGDFNSSIEKDKQENLKNSFVIIDSPAKKYLQLVEDIRATLGNESQERGD